MLPDFIETDICAGVSLPIAEIFDESTRYNPKVSLKLLAAEPISIHSQFAYLRCEIEAVESRAGRFRPQISETAGNK
jgi:hypothetical protein